MRDCVASRKLNQTVPAALTIKPNPYALLDNAVLLQQRLTISHQPGHLVERLRGEDQRRLRHPLDRLSARLVRARPQMVMPRARRRDYLRRRHASAPDIILLHFRHEALREARECRLLSTPP